LRDALDPVPAVVDRIAATLADNPPLNLRDGGAIKAGVDTELDELRSIARDSKSILVEIESRERERTGISSLKVRFNSVFGYYIEVSKTNLAKVPDDYIRKQTLVNAERYITPDLKVLEEKIVGAEGKAIIIEERLYADLLDGVARAGGAILSTARAVGEVDAVCSLATIAVTRTAGGAPGAVNESVYGGNADIGSNFRIDSCQYVYNLNSRTLGVGTYRVDILISGQVVGSASFGLN